jgi:hypothetical protein
MTMAGMDIRLQRTPKGEGEIKKKSHALTQSQRLILASIDGVSEIADLQRRLGGMAKRRFTLAIADLTAKGLVQESPEEVIVPDKLDPQTLELFVRQDPLDPVTITSLQLQPVGRAPALRKKKPVRATASPAPQSAAPAGSAAPASGSKTLEVDFYIPLEARGKPLPPPVWQPPGEANLITTNGVEEKSSSSRRRARRAQRSRQIQIGYWLLFAGLVCAILFFVSLHFH